MNKFMVDEASKIEIDMIALDWGIIPPSIALTSERKSLDNELARMNESDARAVKRKFRKFKRKMMAKIGICKENWKAADVQRWVLRTYLQKMHEGSVPTK